MEFKLEGVVWESVSKGPSLEPGSAEVAWSESERGAWGQECQSARLGLALDKARSLDRLELTWRLGPQEPSCLHFLNTRITVGIFNI